MKENRSLQPRTPFRQRIILILFGISLFFVLFEVGLRIGGFILLSLQEHRNKLSIRQKGTYRILCLGESTTVRQWPPFLKEILNQRNIGIKFVVIDKGIPGANTGFIVSQLEANLDKYQPDLVVTMMGINDYGAHMPYEAGSTTQIMLFFKSFKTYKLTRLLWLHIITKAKEMGFYKPEKNNWLIQRLQHNLQEIGLKAAYTKEDNLIQWETAFKKALELNPQNYQADVELGRFYISQGKPGEAEQVFKKALELNPQNDQADVELGRFYISQGKPGKAEQLFKKALELNPQNYQAHVELAVIYGEMGNYILYKEYEEKAKQIRERFYNPITFNNYRRFKQILNRKKVKWICVQYPVRSIEPLKKIFEGKEGIFFVDNEEIFKSVVLREGYGEYFRDIFGGDFGHCTEKGNRLLAENIANVILKEIFGK